MKSFLIIGMGRFGQHLSRNLIRLGNDVMIVDQNEEKLEELLPIVTSAKIGDCTKADVLKSFGVANFDMYVNFRVKYHVSIIGTKENGETNLLPSADHIFKKEEHLMIIGKKKDVDALLKNMK